MRLVQTLTLTALALAATPVAAQTALNATFSGTATTNILNPIPGQQTFTLSGNFLTYLASNNLPQITGNDLNRYSFSVTGTSSNFDDVTRTTTYSNVTGSIFYTYNDGSRASVQDLAPTTLTVTFDPTFSTGAILGSLLSSGPVTPPGFPGPVNFTPANGAQIIGTYVSNGPQNGTVTGNITFPAAVGDVPEPATWGMMILGFGMAGAAVRRRRPAALAA